jgi:hypothetical protein
MAFSTMFFGAPLTITVVGVEYRMLLARPRQVRLSEKRLLWLPTGDWVSSIGT